MKVPCRVPVWVVLSDGVQQRELSDTYYTTKAEALRAYAARLDQVAAGKADELLAAKAAASRAHAAAWAQEVKP